MSLKPHPPLTRSPDGDATGIPRLRAPSHGEGFIGSGLLPGKAYVTRSPDGNAASILRLRAPDRGEGLCRAVQHALEPSPEEKVAAEG